MNKNKLVKIILAAIVVLAVVFAYWLKANIWADRSSGPEKTFVIESGQVVKEISSNLYAEKLIKSKFIFETYIWLLGLGRDMQAGEYHIKEGVSVKNLVWMLTSGQGSNEREVKIIEGWTAKDMAEYFKAEGLDDIAFTKEVKNLKKWQGKEASAFLKEVPAGGTLEGFLFPDTYRIFKDSSTEEIIKKMLDNFSLKLTPQMREDIAKAKRTIFETVTMASILEKEVRGADDRAMVADIFYKRLQVGMPLQADSTVNYVTGGKSPSISLDDRKISSPYNTYKHRGLPPGPISNPGLDAIEAAIYPKKNDYWYFLSTPDGETIFSKTLEEHNRAKAKYLK